MGGNTQDLEDFQPWGLYWTFVIWTVQHSIPSSSIKRSTWLFSLGTSSSLSCEFHGLPPTLALAVGCSLLGNNVSKEDKQIEPNHCDGNTLNNSPIVFFPSKDWEYLWFLSLPKTHYFRCTCSYFLFH